MNDLQTLFLCKKLWARKLWLFGLSSATFRSNSDSKLEYVDLGDCGIFLLLQIVHG